MRRYAVFRGNGNSYLRLAFSRRPQWRSAEPDPHVLRAPSKSNTRLRQALEHATAQLDSPQNPTKLEENLLLSKALQEGNVHFVFRDLLVVPHHVDGKPLAADQKPPTASLFSAAHPAVVGDGQPQVVNRWPRHSTLTSKDGSLRSLLAYYRAQGLSPWRFLPLSFALPNFALSRSEPGQSAPWQAFVDAHSRVGRGTDPRVPSEQSGSNVWLLKPTNGPTLTSD